MGKRNEYEGSIAVVERQIPKATEFIPTLEIGTSMSLYNFVSEHEEPYEGRLSRTVPWERGGEIPLRDSTVGQFNRSLKQFRFFDKVLFWRFRLLETVS